MISRRGEGARFILVFALVALALSAVYCFPYRVGGTAATVLRDYLQVYARVAGALLALFDPSVRVSGSVIGGDRFALQIVRDCDAMHAHILFVSAVMAYPAGWRQRLIGLVGGAGAITSVNLVRLCSVYAAGACAPRALDFVHLELWPVLLIAATISCFLAWVAWTTPRARRVAV